MCNEAPYIKNVAPVRGGVVAVAVEEYIRLTAGLTTKAKSAERETGAVWK